MTAHAFGPVPSRRLGRSLGVDLVPFKTCTYGCIYCQLGRTTCKTLERLEWVPLDEVLTELGSRLDSHPDYITLSGKIRIIIQWLAKPTQGRFVGDPQGRVPDVRILEGGHHPQSSPPAQYQPLELDP